MAAEVLQGMGIDGRGFFWNGGGAFFTGYLPPNSTAPDRTVSRCNNFPRLNLPCVDVTSADRNVMYAARSRHPGGVQALMCDGSGRFIRQTISINTWRALSTSRGGEPVTLD